MTPAELPAYLTAIRERVAAAEIPVAQQMGAAYRSTWSDSPCTSRGLTRR